MTDLFNQIFKLTEDVSSMKSDVARIPGIEAKLDLLIAAKHEQRGISKLFKYVLSFLVGIFSGASAQ